MKKKMKIKGKIDFYQLETGFWGIEDENGNKWRPVNLPKKLQKKGLEVELKIKPTDEMMSVLMWGKAVEIV